MVKKQYITPEMEVMELESESLMLTMSDTEIDPDNQLSIGRDGRRGQWGNLWGIED